MRKILRAVGMGIAALSVVIGGSGCVVETTTNSPANINTNENNNANNASPSPIVAPIAENTGAGKNTPVTLPVLDAMFADEGFAGELKMKLQLSDDEVARLREVAREARLGLREGAGDDHRGTTADAQQRAAEKINELIGEAKAQQLAAYVRERWTTGGESGAPEGLGALPAAPNTVPTDTRVVVNAPAYRMDVFENGRLIKSYKVGIGYPEFPLPIGLRKASTIIFNPTWTPPDEPWVEGSSQVKAGQKIEAGSKLNPLGLIKIPIGLPSLIHGGKSPAKLGTFASHGCVGLTDPLIQDFALLLAKTGGTEISPEDLTTYAKNRTETKNVKIATAIPVELRYETIVVEDGKLHIYRDVYDRGTNIEENLRAVLETHGVSLDQLTDAERAQTLKALAQMARDARGQPAGGDGATDANANAAASKNSNSRIITRTVKGQREVVVEIAALAGKKGYPAPVGDAFAPTRPGKKSDARARG